tara:strand:- start:93 stop:719 length:627 start_codon:yes stop_codon:yes gene_type:complete
MNFIVKPIKSSQCKEWLLYKHYAKRMCSISYSFGLFSNKELIGIMTIGKPASNNLCIGVCGKENSKYVYELNRLCVNDNLPKNTLSFFVGQCLKILPKMILVSYADTLMNHNGYIYQATNWFYTGKTKERTDIGTENGKHSRHYDKKIDYKKHRIHRSSKHRYIYFIGNKAEKRYFKKCLNYQILSYPKGQNKRYDASYKPLTQTELF